MSTTVLLFPVTDIELVPNAIVLALEPLAPKLSQVKVFPFKSNVPPDTCTFEVLA